MLAPTINLTIFIMMTIIYLNELRHISAFIYNFNYIRNMSKIVMEQKCNNIYCEAETDRYQVAKNSYNLLLPNDVFNSKSYIIMTFVISILIFMYYYYLLFDSQESSKYYYVLNISLLSILLGMIIYRYVPNDETGYLNYFKDSLYTDQYRSFSTLVFFLLILVIYSTYKIKSSQMKANGASGDGASKNFIILVKSLCFMFSILILFNLMNIVMSFRVNTKPMLKTNELIFSLKQAFKVSYSEDELNSLLSTYPEEVKIYKKWRDGTSLDNKETILPSTLAKVLNILIAFDELAKIKNKNMNGDDNDEYIGELKSIISENDKFIDADIVNIDKDTSNGSASTFVTELPLIFDKNVKIPHNYNKKDKKGDGSKNNNIDENITNTNANNPDYVYTADISYDNPNLFYEKYWDMDDSFLSKYSYFVPTFLFASYSPNLFKIMVAIIVFIVVIMILYGIGFPLQFIKRLDSSAAAEIVSELYTTLQPLCVIVILIVYIIIFISFNTNFNDKVVYKCLDSSYKRSLNKLNNIVSPYIRMYDNKIIKSHKNYLHHYIISNVFYSILSGNIKLQTTSTTSTYGVEVKSVNEGDENKTYYDILKIKSNRLKFAAMNNTILSNDNEFREYYKAKFGKLYSDNYDNYDNIEAVYNVFPHIFAEAEHIGVGEDIDDYFKEVVLTTDKVFQIYCIIQKCFELFKEDKFNNNLIYFNNHENKQKGIDIAAYDKFKFYKYGDTVTPYKFILELRTIDEYNAFVKDITTKQVTMKDKSMKQFTEKFKENINEYFNIPLTVLPTATAPTQTTQEATQSSLIGGILEDSDEQDLTTQASSMENLQDKNLLKIITKYLLILGHLNYNRVEYYSYKTSNSADDKAYMKEIYEKKTYYLYKLFSNTLYRDTYDIDDTFLGNISPTLNKLVSIEVNKNYNGANYATAPNVVINGGTVPTGGTLARATAVLGTGANADKVVSITVTNTGSGYKTVPPITFTGGTAITGKTITLPTATAKVTTNLQIEGDNDKYKNLTYIYNYLETKYVSVSSNNNRNYLMNIVKSINNKINEGEENDKVLSGDRKDSRYFFYDRIDKMTANPPDYETEDGVLDMANNISTNMFAITYIVNIVILIVYFYMIARNNK